MTGSRRWLALTTIALTVAVVTLVAIGSAPTASDPHAVGSDAIAVPSPSTPDSSIPPADPARLGVAAAGWRTEFAVASVDLAEFVSGGPGKDGIPAIDDPAFESLDSARGWLDERAPVIALEISGQARAYPLAILTWHEIVNDTLGDVPVVVTFCPLCHTALVFERRVDGVVHDFGTTGNLRFSDLVMYDRQTESWWQQATGEAIVGELTGTRLTFLPSQIVSFAEFAATYPTADVLSRDTGHRRDYGRNPYPGYDRADERPFLFEGVVDGRIAPKERVATVRIGDEAVAYPYSELTAVGVVQDRIAGQPVAVFWQAGTASALDAPMIDDGRDAGATGVFRPVARGRTLTFERSADGTIRDRETDSVWSVTGVATGGPMEGERLEPIPHGDHFWFAWAAFEPATRIWTSSGAVTEPSPSGRTGLAAVLPEAVDGLPVGWIDVDVARLLADTTRNVDIGDLRSVVRRSGAGPHEFRMVIGEAHDDVRGSVFLTAFQASGVAGSRLAGIVRESAIPAPSDRGALPSGPTGLLSQVVTVGDAAILVSASDPGLHAAALAALAEP